VFSRALVAGLVLLLLAGLPGAAALAQSPTPTPPPIPTWPAPHTAPPTPLPPPCLGRASLSPLAPNPPTNLRAELVSSPDVLEGFIVKVEWLDNADDDLCYVIERKVGAGDWSLYERGTFGDPSNKGLVFREDVPQQVGLDCYRVYVANEAGRSAYSNEACVDVQGLPTILTPTPPRPTPTPPWPTPRPPAPPVFQWAPLGCHYGVGPSPKAPPPPANVRAGYSPGVWNLLVQWDDLSDNEACFVVERSPAATGPWEPVAVTEANTTNWMDVSVPPKTQCYKVYAVNAYGRADVDAFCVPPRLPPPGGAGAAPSTTASLVPWALIVGGVSLSLTAGAVALSLVVAAGRRR